MKTIQRDFKENEQGDLRHRKDRSSISLVSEGDNKSKSPHIERK